MNEELNKELSRLQLLNSRYKNKLRMCPLEIKKEEVRAFIVFNYIKQLQQENTQLKENNISRELIRKRIKEIYEEYLQEYPKRFENEYYLMSRYALKVLVDIYSFDDDEENRLIHHDWDIIESAIEFILEEELKGSENK